MNNLIRMPLLAPSQIQISSDLAERLPLMGSPKLDGVRGLFYPESPTIVSRQGKQFPNKELVRYFKPFVDYVREKRLIFDGEFWAPKLTFHQILSLVRSHGKPLVDSGLEYHVFDCIAEDEWMDISDVRLFSFRLMDVDALKAQNFRYIRIVPQTKLETIEQIEQFYAAQLALGFEGAMVRSPDGKYKHGRATVREGIMFKMKPVDFDRARIVGYYPLYVADPDSPMDVDEFGYAKTSNRLCDQIPVEALGGFIVQDIETEIEFRIGSGFDMSNDPQRGRYGLWLRKEKLLNRIVTYKHQKSGSKDKPRFPVFDGLEPESESETEETLFDDVTTNDM